MAQRIYSRGTRPGSGLAEVYGEQAILSAMQEDYGVSDLSIQYALEIGGVELAPSIERLRDIAKSREDRDRVNEYEAYLNDLRLGLRR